MKFLFVSTLMAFLLLSCTNDRSTPPNTTAEQVVANPQGVPQQSGPIAEVEEQPDSKDKKSPELNEDNNTEIKEDISQENRRKLNRKDACSQNKEFCVGDKVITKKGNLATVVGVYSDNQILLKFKYDEIEVSPRKIKYPLPRHTSGFPNTLDEEVEENAFVEGKIIEIFVNNVALTGGCPARYDQCYRMRVYIDGVLVALWKTTPGMPHSDGGGYTPEWTLAKVTRVTHKNYKSGKYPRPNGGAPMPYAVFFNNTGIAIHGSYGKVNGERDSYGCLRLKPQQAKKLFGWIKNVGSKNVFLTVRDTRP